MEILEEYVDVDGVRLWTAGQGSGIPVLLCHGGPGACDNLGPVAAMIDQRARVHRFDQRGCGRSDDAPPHTLERGIADIEALRRHWGYDRWIIGGHSWGAMLAMAYALEHPQRVWGALLISSSGIDPIGPEYRANYRRRLTVEDLARLDELQELRSRAAPDEMAAIREEMTRIKLMADLSDPATALDLPRYPCRMNFAVNAALYADWLRYMAQPGIDVRAVRIGAPAMIVNGEDDPRPADGARRLAALLPDAVLELLPGAGHYPWLEHPERLRRALERFMANIWWK